MNILSDRCVLRRKPRSALFSVLLFFAVACQGEAAPLNEDDFAVLRNRMVDQALVAADITSTPTLQAMRAVPRHHFVPPSQIPYAYENRPLPIGHDQTISQPYIVAIMTQLLNARPTDKVLEVGTGSGYQAAVLAEIVDQVYSIEIVEPLAREAEKRLADLGYRNIHVRAGDGYRGWPEEAPFDAVIVTAAPDHVPAPLKEQLKIGGRLVIPVGDDYQELLVITRTEDGYAEQRTLPVRFVPMTGEAQTKN